MLTYDQCLPMSFEHQSFRLQLTFELVQVADMVHKHLSLRAADFAASLQKSFGKAWIRDGDALWYIVVCCIVLSHLALETTIVEDSVPFFTLAVLIG